MVVRSQEKFPRGFYGNIDDNVDISSTEATSTAEDTPRPSRKKARKRPENIEKPPSIGNRTASEVSGSSDHVVVKRSGVRPQWDRNLLVNEFTRPRDRKIVNLDSCNQSMISTTSGLSNMSTMSTRRPRVLWSKSEVEMLLAGCRKYGRNWRTILKNYNFHIHRTPTDLKDKFRNLEKNMSTQNPLAEL